MRAKVEHYRSGGLGVIDERLRELDERWSMEWALEANASCLALLGIGLSRASNRMLLRLPALLSDLFLESTFQGWLPPGFLFCRCRVPPEVVLERRLLLRIREHRQANREPPPTDEILRSIAT
ncbi:MAG: hypothetical protein ACOC1F_07475 [Myxococcota bacterium]